LTRSAAARAFKASVPVFFGYVPLGVAFGLLFNTLGYRWPYAALSGLIVFAGAAQFLSVGLLAAHAGLAAVFAATLSLNLRHMFYGFSLLRRFPERGWRRYYMIFALTDETYSVLTATKLRDRAEDERFCLTVSALNHSYWVAGCALGAFLGSRARVETKGLEFVLTALFVVLAVEQALTVRRWLPFVVASAAALLVCPGQMLLASLAIVFAVLFWMAEKDEVIA
jgi:4-azaleucine resistance transporter AzlC